VKEINMAIKFIETDGILSDDALVLVCPTNAGGVMGTGLAKAFRTQIPGLFKAYTKHCRKHRPESMVHFVHPHEGQAIYCLHTKVRWRNGSSLEIVREGLERLIKWCKENDIESVALPMLGCGKGALEVRDVKPIMEELLTPGNVDFRVYCP
jgi:O-acetyl-ADP-ribose deacetylase (regulator of RNase III)